MNITEEMRRKIALGKRLCQERGKFLRESQAPLPQPLPLPSSTNSKPAKK